MDAIEHQVRDLRNSIVLSEARKRQLEEENEEAERQLKRRKGDVAELEQKHDALQNAVLADLPNDEVLQLDVGGTHFKAYRSTLAQFKDSVLATLVSTRWAEGARQPDGRIFIDWDPDAFGEILSFLRMHRLGGTEDFLLSKRAASLCRYLHIPVGRINGSECLSLSAASKGTSTPACIKGGGFVFNIAWKGLRPCSLSAFEVESGTEARLSLHLRKDGHGPFEQQFESGLDNSWCLAQQTVIHAGKNMFILPRGVSECWLRPNEKIGVYMKVESVTGLTSLVYSRDEPSITYTRMDGCGQPTVHGSMLTCTPGRHVDPGFKSGADGPRFFLGRVVYEVEP